MVARYTITVNGSAGTDPSSVIPKLELLIEAAQKLGVQLNAEEMFQAILNAVELPVSTAKILMQQAGVPGMEGMNGPITEDQLLELLAQLRGQMAPGAMAGGVGGAAAPMLPGGPGGVSGGALPPAGPGANV
jgi:hypothetical protein